MAVLLDFVGFLLLILAWVGVQAEWISPERCALIAICGGIAYKNGATLKQAMKHDAQDAFAQRQVSHWVNESMANAQRARIAEHNAAMYRIAYEQLAAQRREYLRSRLN